MLSHRLATAALGLAVALLPPRPGVAQPAESPPAELTLEGRERLKLAREAEEAAASMAHSTQRRFEAGDVPVVDVNVTRVALARARAEVAGAEGDEASLLLLLRALLGMGLARPLGVRGE